MDSRDRFTATVEAYDRYRPDYPDALLDWVVARASSVVDVGSGTGIFSRQLASRGIEVIGVEPNGAMRDAAAARGGGPRYVAGDAEATGLDDAVADWVIGAQAFHWFDLDRALPELERVARRGVLAVWNVRLESGLAAAYDALLHEVSADFRAVAKPGPTLEALRARRSGGEELDLPHAQVLDAEGLRGRAWSSSYVVHGVSDAAAFDRRLGEIFEAYAEEEDGRRVVRLPYRTRGYAWAVGG